MELATHEATDSPAFFSGAVDVEAALGAGAVGQLIHLTYEGKSTGGAGQTTAMRLNRPSIMRAPFFGEF